jgi:hypothetical protein
MTINPNVIIAGAGLSITDANGVRWSIVNGQVTANGIADPTTSRVVELAYGNGKLWQRNADNLWRSKATAAETWKPPAGTTVNPVPASPDNTLILSPGLPITDAKGNAWSMINGHVAVNGVIDTTTSRVTELAYEKGKIWLQNADHLWWNKSKPADAWGPPNGTPVDPEGPVICTWLPGGVDYNDPRSWSPYGVPRGGDTVSLISYRVRPVVMAMNNTQLPRGLNILAADGGAPVTMNLGGAVSNAAVVRAVSGTLDIAVGNNGIVVNTGEIGASGGATTSAVCLTLGAGSRFENAGTISALGGGGSPANAPTSANVTISGAGTFTNEGLIQVQNGSFNLTTTGSLSNFNKLIVGGSGTGTVQFGNYGVTTQFNNFGTIEADGHATVSIVSPHMFEVCPGTIQNNGLIEADGGHVDISAPLKQSASGLINIDHGGSVTLGYASDGGTIQITDGMLNFAGTSRSTYGPLAAREFDTTLRFIGNSGKLDFADGLNVTETFQAISQSQAELLVYTSYYPGDHRPLADIHLAGHYTADQFQAVGSTINFLAHPI